MITIHGRESYFIKKKDVPVSVIETLKQEFTHYFFAEKACAECEFKPERLKSETKLTPTCEECAAFKGGAQLATDVKIGKNKYLKTPSGNLGAVTRLLEKKGIDYKVKTHFPDARMKRPFKFIGTFKGEYQREAANAIIKKKKGVLRAPPRSGKTVIATAAVCKLGRKTMILASQREWLLGFQETFIGSKTQKPLTTCRPEQIGIAKTLADFKKYDVCLVTVQTFYSENGQRLLERVRDMFEVIITDEVHTGAAPKYATVLNSLNCKWKIGLSGTPDRKDGRYVLMRNIVGPIIYEAKVERLRPHIKLVRTEYVKKTAGQVMWARMISSIEKDPKRLKLIAKWALRDVKNGHMVLIPFAQVTPIKALTKAINIMAGKDIARPFYGGLKKKDRDLYLQAARTYKVKVLVGNIKLLSTGTNIPRASALYEVTLSSNAPNAEQRFSRVLTPWEDKPQPIIRIFLDDMSVRRRCLSNEFWNVLKPKFRPVISQQDDQTLRDYFRGKSNERIQL